MPIIQFIPRAAIQQIEIPAEVAEGSGKDRKVKKLERTGNGTLYVRPGATRVVTADELAFLKADKQHKRLFRVIAEKDPEPKPKPDSPEGKKLAENNKARFEKAVKASQEKSKKGKKPAADAPKDG